VVGHQRSQHRSQGKPREYGAGQSRTGLLGTGSRGIAEPPLDMVNHRLQVGYGIPREQAAYILELSILAQAQSLVGLGTSADVYGVVPTLRHTGCLQVSVYWPESIE